jgi:hypothetical protein
VITLFPCESCVVCGNCPEVLTLYSQERYKPCDPSTNPASTTRLPYDRMIVDLLEPVQTGSGTGDLVPAGSSVTSGELSYAAFGANPGGIITGAIVSDYPVGQTDCLPTGGDCPTSSVGSYCIFDVPQDAAEHILTVSLSYSGSGGSGVRTFVASEPCMDQNGNPSGEQTGTIAGSDRFELDTVAAEYECWPCIEITRNDIMLCTGSSAAVLWSAVFAGATQVKITTTLAGVDTVTSMGFNASWWYYGTGACATAVIGSNTWLLQQTVPGALTQVEITGGSLAGVYRIPCIRAPDGVEMAKWGTGSSPGTLPTEGTSSCGSGFDNLLVSQTKTYDCSNQIACLGGAGCDSVLISTTGTSSGSVSGTAGFPGGCALPRYWYESAFEKSQIVNVSLATSDGTECLCIADVLITKSKCSNTMSYLINLDTALTVGSPPCPSGSTNTANLDVVFEFDCSSRKLRFRFPITVLSGSFANCCVNGYENRVNFGATPFSYAWYT